MADRVGSRLTSAAASPPSSSFPARHDKQIVEPELVDRLCGLRLLGVVQVDLLQAPILAFSALLFSSSSSSTTTTTTTTIMPTQTPAHVHIVVEPVDEQSRASLSPPLLILFPAVVLDWHCARLMSGDRIPGDKTF